MNDRKSNTSSIAGVIFVLGLIALYIFGHPYIESNRIQRCIDRTSTKYSTENKDIFINVCNCIAEKQSFFFLIKTKNIGRYLEADFKQIKESYNPNGRGGRRDTGLKNQTENCLVTYLRAND